MLNRKNMTIETKAHTILTLTQRPEADFKLLILISVFIGMLVGMNLLGGKIITVFGVSASVAVFMVPLAFAITDISTELYGRSFSRKLTFAGMMALAILMVYSVIFVSLPPNPRFVHDEAYRTIFGTSLRIMLASITAFGLAQLQDIFIFERIRHMTNGKWLWLRTNLSTFASELVDTTVFMFIAFYAVTPKFDALFIIKLIIPYLLLKVAFAVLITPLVYGGVRLLKQKGEGE